MKTLFKTLLFIIVTLTAFELVQAQSEPDPPSGYTTNYRFRQYAEGAYPSADSINKNLVDIDNAIKNRDKRIDSLKTAFTAVHNFPSGSLKTGIINQQHILNQAVRATHLDSNMFKDLGGLSYFKKVTDGEGELLGYIPKVNTTQLDNDTFAIKPGATLPHITVNDYLTVNGRFRIHKGSDVASGTLLELGLANFFLVTGETPIEQISGDNFTAGSFIFLKIIDGVRLTQGSSGIYELDLQGGTNWDTTPNDRIILLFNGVYWDEFARVDN